MKFLGVYEPTKLRVMELAPSLTVSVPLALAPEVTCVQERVLLPGGVGLAPRPCKSGPPATWSPQAIRVDPSGFGACRASRHRQANRPKVHVRAL
jgi:hypothetical protein